MYALRILGDPDIAEDVVEEVFVKIWQKSEEGLELKNIDRYLYQCVRNECLSWLRSRNEVVGLVEIEEINEEIIDTSERDACLWRAIDALPEKCRKVFLLSKGEGKSNAEIADLLGISVKTVKNQMTKAFSRLRNALGGSKKPFFLPFL